MYSDPVIRKMVSDPVFPIIAGKPLLRFLLTLASLVFATGAAIDLQGHRGARGLAPENTLPAFAAALEIGVDTLELDTGVTRDGVVVIGHDPSLNPDIARDASGAWLEGKGPAIHDLSFAELQAYDIGRLKPGTVYAGRYPAQKPVDGTRYAKLADLFAMVEKSGNRKVRFNIETKLSPQAPGETLAPEPFTRALLDVIRASGMSARVTIQSFDWRTLRIAQELAPGIPTACLTAQQKFLDNVQAEKGSSWTAGIQFRDHASVPKMVKAAGCAVWSPYFGDVDAASVAQAKALGLKVIVWTVNDPGQVKAMVELGVDGIITDRPDIVKPLVK
jgi:glycerophosphoryl diester phosphodiesterase